MSNIFTLNDHIDDIYDKAKYQIFNYNNNI